MDDSGRYSNGKNTSSAAVNRRRTLWSIVILLLICAGCFTISPIAGRIYTTWWVTRLHSHDVYPTAEAAMRALIEKGYRGITDLNILYAGPNAHDGSSPHVWYVIAEVRAEQRADGTQLEHNGCDAPGTFFFQSKQGWFHVPEGLFTGLLGKWMGDYGLAGQGSSTPAIKKLANRPTRFCQ